jgi:beta-amylase
MRAQVGEFQCYDRRALASLAAAAQEAGHPEWGYTGPHDAGHYNSTPEVGGTLPACRCAQSSQTWHRD